MDTYLIDCNNLIHSIPEYKNKFSGNPDAVSNALIQTVNLLLGISNVIFFFDGFGSIKSSNVKYSNGKTADDLIRSCIENNYKKKKLIVISSDSSIRNLAKVCSCVVMESQEFWNSINLKRSKNLMQNTTNSKHKHEKPVNISKKEFNEFKKYFS
jgi:predicted RNA-binding protein with PIN domain